MRMWLTSFVHARAAWVDALHASPARHTAVVRLSSCVNWSQVQDLSVDERLQWLARTLGMPAQELRALRPLSFASVNDNGFVVECDAGGEEERHFLLRDICDAPIRARELAFSEGRLGGTVWPSSLVLAHCVATDIKLGRAQGEVLELGAGVGLASLAVAAAGGRATATDLEEEAVEGLVANLKHNAAINGLSAAMRCRRLDWREPASWLPQQFELVMGSDLLYAEENVAPLAATLARHVKPGGIAVLVSPESTRAGVPLDVHCLRLEAGLPDGTLEREEWWLRTSPESVQRFRCVRWRRAGAGETDRD